MPTLQEQLDETKARLNALIAPAVTEEPAAKLEAADILTAVTDELKKGNVSKERAEYLKGVMEALAKNNFEATSFAALPIHKDPDQIVPQVVAIATLQTLAVAKPQTHFSSNLSQAMKAAMLIQKVLVNPELNKELVAKGSYSDKLDDVKDFFGLKDDDLKEEYDLRWKVGDLLSALQQAAKLERFVKEAAEKAEAEAPVTKSDSSHLAPCVWPNDMAAAEYDTKAKTYKRAALPFGTDKETAR